MSEIKNGGPAFPSHGTMGEVTHEGLTLRDYFAIHSGIAADDLSKESAEKLVGRSMPNWQEDMVANAMFWADVRAKLAYLEADAMLRAREAV